MSLRRIDDVPPGTIGFEAIGEVEDDDWEKQVEPVLRSEMAEGQKIRLLYLLGSEAREVEGDAMTADTGFRARFATSFVRVAVVSDESWMRPAMRALSFLLPGRAKRSRSPSWRPQRLGSPKAAAPRRDGEGRLRHEAD
jgi:SpoIIAA-like